MAEQQQPDNTSLKVVPENWAKMFGIDTSLNTTAKDDLFITFTAKTTPKIRYLTTYTSGEPPYDFSASKVIGSYKIFYPKDVIRESFTHEYSTDVSSYDSAMNQAKTAVASVIAAPTSMISSGTKGTVYDAPQIWQKVSRRQFNVNLHLFAYNDMDKDIYDVIKFFRNNSYPTRDGTHIGMIDYPAVFEIQGGVWKTIQAPKYPFYTLETVEVSYADSTKFLKKGLPMSAQLSLTFKETMIVYRDMLNSAPVNVSINSGIQSDLTAQRKVTAALLKPSKNILNTTPPNQFITSSHRVEIGLINRIKYAKGFEPAGSPVPNKSAQSASGSPVSPYASVLKLITNTLLARALKNIETIVINGIKSKLMAMLEANKYYKKLTSVVDIDPRHRVEVLSKLKTVKVAKWVV